MELKKNLTVIASALVISGGVFVACSSSSDNGASNFGGGGAGGGTSGTGGGTGGLLNPDSGAGGYFGDAGPTSDVVSENFDPDAACAASTVSATLIRANILFLIDRTGSMNCNAPPIQDSANCKVNPQKLDPTQPSKWQITRDALSAAMQGLEGTNPLPSIGIMYFNSDDFCGIPAQPNVGVQQLSGDAGNDSQLNALQISLNQVTPKGETPLIGSTMSAYQYLYANAASFDGNRFVVLLTDGTETCDTQDSSKAYLLQKAAEVATALNIRTFVLGAPGSEGERAFLSSLAKQGGTASSPTCQDDCHMDMTLPGMNFADELQKNLTAISGAALSCEFDVPTPGPGEPPVDPAKVNVKYTHGDGTTEYILQDTTIACDDPQNAGWSYSDASATKIVLCGSACDAVKSDPQASISIELGCQTHTVPK